MVEMMTKQKAMTMTMTRMLAVGVAVATMVMAVGCSDTDARPIVAGDSGQATSGLTPAFASRCARCHGTTGKGQAPYPSIPGNLDVNGFIAIVRSGRKEMPIFPASQISDDELKADYDWLKTKR